ncbi:6-phospho-3-hexuloisomerase [Apibacter sp. HY039]|uniref:6-phospho-3-hexuloisomerase n=1 Tax=Apibacter sp. HY039 TaxID=2501476 RepID=UPI000FEBDA10|nr:6-phospho-3-hexuloisomerase [Apibacter sp. HY039]
MKTKEKLQKIIQELSFNSSLINDDEVDNFVAYIMKANRIYLAGAGRSGYVIRCFANRLMHLGFSVNFVGDATTPHSKKGDLLIIGSGSGETQSLVAMANKAKKSGLDLALITLNPHSSIGLLANAIIPLPGVSPKADQKITNKTLSIQPMGSAFEQLSFLLYDAIVLSLMDQLKETGDSMFARHADLE